MGAKMHLSGILDLVVPLPYHSCDMPPHLIPGATGPEHVKRLAVQLGGSPILRPGPEPTAAA